MPKPKYKERKGTARSNVATRPRPRTTGRSRGFWHWYSQTRLFGLMLLFAAVAVSGIGNGILQRNLLFILAGVLCAAVAVLFFFIIRDRASR